MLLDTHHHLDFLDEALRPAFLARLAELDVGVVAQTLLPSTFPEPVEGTRWSVGFHPWSIDPHRIDVELAHFEQALAHTRFVGEVGLDFSPRRLDEVPLERQVRVFEGVLWATARAARDRGSVYVMSIHTVRSAGTVLDLLEDSGALAAGVVPVFHRFNGTSDELTRLVRLGGYLSVHPSLLRSKRGRVYVRQAPAEQLLLETDLPEAPVDAPPNAVDAEAHRQAEDVASSLHRTVELLGELRGEDVGAQLGRTQQQLYGVPAGQWAV